MQQFCYSSNMYIYIEALFFLGFHKSPHKLLTLVEKCTGTCGGYTYTGIPLQVLWPSGSVLVNWILHEQGWSKQIISRWSHSMQTHMLLAILLPLHVCTVMYHLFKQVHLLKTEGVVLILLTSGVDTANKLCSAYIKHQRDLYAQRAPYPVYNTGCSFEVWLQQDIHIYIYIYLFILLQMTVHSFQCQMVCFIYMCLFSFVSRVC